MTVATEIEALLTTHGLPTDPRYWLGVQYGREWNQIYTYVREHFPRFDPDPTMYAIDGGIEMRIKIHLEENDHGR